MNTRKTPSIIVCFLLLFTFQLTAQSFFDVGRLEWMQLPAKLKESNEEATINQWKAALNLGFKTVGEDRILISWAGEKRDIGFNMESPYQKAIYLNSVNLGYIRNWQENPWKLLILGRGKLGSDYDIWSSDDFSWGFLAAATYTNANNVSFTFGGYYGQELFGSLIFPILGLETALSEKAYLYAFFPSEVRLEYALNPQKLYANLILNWNTNSYGLHNVPQNTYVRMQELLLRASLDFNLDKRWVIFAALGHTLINTYELETDARMVLKEEPYHFDFKNSLILDFGLAFRIRFKN